MEYPNNIKHLKTFYQKDIFPNMEISDTVLEDRITGKAIMTDSEGKIALVGSDVSLLYTLPGGGIEDGESIEAGIIRESKEETGCIVEIAQFSTIPFKML